MMWVILATTNRCRIYDYARKPKKLTLLKEMEHVESRLKDSDLISSAPGHYRSSSGAAHGAYSPRKEPKEIEIENFSREIARELDRGRKNNSYKNLILIVPPYMNGLIHQHLDEQSVKLILADIKKDYIHLTEDQLLNILTEELQRF